MSMFINQPATNSNICVDSLDGNFAQQIDAYRAMFPLFQNHKSGARLLINKNREVATNQGIIKPNDNDVLLGRGHCFLHHPGNKRFRQYVQEQKVHYVATPKSEKPLFSKMILNAIKTLNPPGRYLRRDTKTGLWFEVSNDQALRKTRQALREGAKLIQAQLKSTCQNELHDGVLTNTQLLAPNSISPFLMNLKLAAASQRFRNEALLPIPSLSTCESQQNFESSHLSSILQNIPADSAIAIHREDEKNRCLQDALTYGPSQTIDSSGYTQQITDGKGSTSIFHDVPGNKTSSSSFNDVDYNSIRQDSSLWANYPIPRKEDELLHEVEANFESCQQIPSGLPLGRSLKRSSVVLKNPEDMDINLCGETSKRARRSSHSSISRSSFTSLRNFLINFDEDEPKATTSNLSKEVEGGSDETLYKRRRSSLRMSFLSVTEFSGIFDEYESKTTTSDLSKEMDGNTVHSGRSSPCSTIEDFMMPGIRFSFSENMSSTNSAIFSNDQEEYDE